jgi:hypothetical protein
MTLIYIIIALVFITAIVKIVLFVIEHDRCPEELYIPTLDEVFPNQKENIPPEEFEQIKKRIDPVLNSMGDGRNS